MANAKISELPTAQKVGNILDETLKVGGGATTATTPTVTIPRETATTNTVEPLLRVQRTSSGTPANGIGASIEFEVETSAANNEIGASIEAVTTDVTAASEDFDLVFKTMAAGAAAAEALRLKSTGAAVITVSVASSTGLRINNAAAQAAYSIEIYNSGGTRQAYWGTVNNADYYLFAGFNASVSGSFTVGTVTYVNTAGVVLSNTGLAAWTSGNADQTKDAGLARNASGVPEVNNGTKGSYTGTALRLGTQTIAQLPAAATAGSGARATVSDALTPTFQATVAAGGAVVTPVYSDGANWKVG